MGEMGWRELWTIGLGLNLPDPILAPIVFTLLFAFLVIPGQFLFAILNRKIAGDLQARVGPAFAGPAGSFQPLADFLKLLQKHRAQKNLKKSQKIFFWLCLQLVLIFTTFPNLPLSRLTLLVDTDMSAFFPILGCLSLSLAILMMGFSEESIEGVFGGLRVLGQTLATIFPIFIAILCVAVKSGGLHWGEIVKIQGPHFWQWNCFSSPFQFLAAFLFIVCSQAFLNKAPMESGYSPEIKGGVSSFLVGWHGGLFSFQKSYFYFYWMAIAVTLFFGGWTLPPSVESFFIDHNLVFLFSILETLNAFFKTIALMLIVEGLARLNIRKKGDHIFKFSWFVLSPMALVALLGTVLWKN